jgi:hypothetical protein
MTGYSLKTLREKKRMVTHSESERIEEVQDKERKDHE